MTEERRKSGFGGLDLEDICDQQDESRPPKHEIDARSTTPSREVRKPRTSRMQVNLSLTPESDERLRRIAEREGKSLAKMIDAFMDRWERR